MKPERIEELIAHNDMAHVAASKALPSSAELLHLLRCARAWAELETWLEADARRSITLNGLRIKGVDSSILTATEAALRASRGEAAPRPEGEMAKAKETPDAT